VTLTHPQPDELPVGTELWHVHPSAFGPTAFNPRSENRFAVIGGRRRRAMYYAGETAEVAIWETILRDVVADTNRSVVLYKDQLAGRVLSRVQTISPVKLIDLTMPALRGHAATHAELADWQELQTTPDYPRTHAAAAALVGTAKVGALKWTSKQAGNGAAYVFYDPPSGSTFKVIEQQSLDVKGGWRWIDAALSQAHIQRIDPATVSSLP
jgi:hypothetical protein